MDKVDVVLLTKNSERVLARCVNSIYQAIPINRLIVVDGYSTDKTISILREFDEKYHNVEVHYDSGTRATARQKGIENVETDWFAFVDSDVVLCKDWHEKAVTHVSEHVGAVWGIEVWSTIKNPSTLKVFLWITRKIFELRGGTHDTLIRTRLVKGIKIPANLHVFEDAYVKNWIQNKGFRVIATYDPFCIHYRPKIVWTFKGSTNIIIDAIKFGNVKLLTKLVFAYGFYAAYSVYQLLSRTNE
jgi:glycosyltransferase involved in cell wall biosynthesis